MVENLVAGRGEKEEVTPAMLGQPLSPGQGRSMAISKISLGTCLIICIVINISQGQGDSPCDEDGKLRLVGGTSARNGRVEICYRNMWGTVCDDLWDDNDAMVVCRQLGYTTIGPIHLDEVQCTGNEEYLVNCSTSEFSEHDCTHQEDAGVNCENFMCENGAVRLVDGYSEYYDGRVEVCIDNKYITICDDGSWGIEEATVVCRQLNFTGPPGSAPLPLSGGMYPMGVGTTSMSGLRCTGSEQNLYACPHRRTLMAVSFTHFSDAGILCPRPHPTCSDNGIRLIGRNPSEGRVEVCINGHWGTICHEGWGIHEAQVVCQQFGYSTEGVIPVGVGEFGRGYGLIFLSNVACNGSEENLTDCPHDIGDNFCTHHQDAGVICADPNNTCQYGEMRLMAGRSPNEGRLEICFHNHWGTVCDDNFHTQEASLVCRELGFPPEGALSLHSAHFGEGVGLILVDDIECRGNETTLLDCFHSGIGTNNCFHNEDVSILCQTMNASCNNGDLRLINGTGPHSERVEVCFSGRWGTICDDNWGSDDATVVCNQLNYPGVSVGLSGSFFGPGSGPIFLDDVRCSPGEHRSLIECVNAEESLGAHNCDHTEDAAVICSSESSMCSGNMSSGGVRLVGGTTELEGRVELCLDGEWGTICDNFWSNFDAAVVCHQLSYGKMHAVAFHGAWFGPGTGSIHLNNLFCSGDEGILTDCNHSDATDSHCTHHQDASVRCRENMCLNGEIRLVGGLLPSEGRVEICIHGRFGTVCDDGWDTPDAQVVCRQLGYNPNRADAVTNGIFGTATLPTFLSTLSCIGGESNLTQCPSNPGRFCPPNRHAGVICYN